MTSICLVKGCSELQRAKGLCTNHYRLLLKIKRSYNIENEKKRYVTITENGITKNEHIHIVEKILGKPLPKNAEVHHVDGNRSNNNHPNLVVCPNRSYHMLIEKRTRAYNACGHPDWIKCQYCKTYDTVENLCTKPEYSYHKKCAREYRKKLRFKKAIMKERE